MLKKYDFGADALLYIKDCLHQGKSLSKYFLDEQILDKGQVSAYLPSNTDAGVKLRFETGGIVSRRKSEIYTANYIKEYLEHSKSNIAVFEDPYKKPTDPVLEKARYQAFFFQTEVYHFLTNENNDTERIIQTLKFSGGYPTIIFLSSLLEPKHEIKIQTRETVPKLILQQLAIGVKHILVGAYDNEGELIWRNILETRPQ